MNFTSDKTKFVDVVKKLHEGCQLPQKSFNMTTLTQEENIPASQEKTPGFCAAIHNALEYIKEINLKHNLLNELQIQETMKLAKHYEVKWNRLIETLGF